MFTLLRSTVSGNGSENRSFFEFIVAEHRCSCCEGTVCGFGFAYRHSFVCFASITLETVTYYGEFTILREYEEEDKQLLDDLRKQKDTGN